MRIIASVILALTLSLAAPLAAQEEWPRERNYDGPMQFCSQFFAIDILDGETAIVRDPGLDFTMTYFEFGEIRLGIYEGNHPQTTNKKAKRTRLIPDVKIERLVDNEGDISYLVYPAPDSRLPTFLHIFGNQFSGSDTDRAILERFVFGRMSKTGCTSATYSR